MDDKTLIFVSDKNRYFFPYIHKEDIDVEEVWKRGVKKKYKLVIRACRWLKLPVGYFFGEWKKTLAEYTRIIIFDGTYDKLLYYFLEKNNKKAKKAIFCWNTKKRLEHIVDSSYNIYSFDQGDCIQCGFEFVSTLYTNQIELPNKEVCYEVLFVGTTKERTQEIFAIYDLLAKHQISKKFYVVGAEEEKHPLILHEKIGYAEYLGMVAQSKALLDINNPDQQGLSLRVMEAVFLNKKLITTNKTVRQYDFYCEENMFIIERLDIELLKKFLEVPYHLLDENIVKKYDVTNWVKNFDLC